MNNREKTEALKRLQSSDGFAAIDLEFAAFICEQAGTDSYELFAAAAIVSHTGRNGNTCCELNQYAGRKFPPQSAEQTAEALPEPEDWIRSLVSFKSGNVIECYPETAKPSAPLVLDTSGKTPRLYLNRFFRYEQHVKKHILSRCVPHRLPSLSPEQLTGISSRFSADSAVPDYQLLALYTALCSRFAIITGGPGTGKTTVAAALLALKLTGNPDLQIIMCAPTGKAQARLKEAVAEETEKLNCPEAIKDILRNHIPCSTIHRLLRTQRGSTQFKHNETNPVAAGLLLVDEVSMVSLPVMAKLLNALRPETDVILLGDQDQLSSVDAGSVLADLYAMGTVNTLPPEAAEEFRRLTSWHIPAVPDTLPLSGCIAELKVNHRASGTNIKKVSGDIRQMEKVLPERIAEQSGRIAEQIIRQNQSDFCTRPLSSSFRQELENEIRTPCTEAGNIQLSLADLPALAGKGDKESLEAAFSIVENFKVLCAVREGPQGVDKLNEMIFSILNLPQENGESFVPGVPVMVTRNRPDLGLYNGDIGLFWKMKDRNSPGIYFRNMEKSFSPVELEYETVFAMTIHKSQGSGFRNVLIVLPEKPAPILTRELLYTAVTRAKERVVLWGSEENIRISLAQRTERQSGLRSHLESL